MALTTLDGKTPQAPSLRSLADRAGAALQTSDMFSGVKGELRQIVLEVLDNVVCSLGLDGGERRLIAAIRERFVGSPEPRQVALKAISGMPVSYVGGRPQPFVEDIERMVDAILAGLKKEGLLQ